MKSVRLKLFGPSSAAHKEIYGDNDRWHWIDDPSTYVDKHLRTPVANTILPVKRIIEEALKEMI